MEGVKWYDHIELAGLFLVGVYVIGSICHAMINKWIDTGNCKSCAAMIAVTVIPEIQRKQADLRESVLPAMKTDIAVILSTVGNIEEKLDNFIENSGMQK